MHLYSYWEASVRCLYRPLQELLQLQQAQHSSYDCYYKVITALFTQPLYSSNHSYVLLYLF